MKKDRTLLVIGAGGVVGTHIASMSVGRFSKLILVDIEAVKDKLNAIARDIRTQFNLANSDTKVVATTNYNEIGKLGKEDVIVIPAGKARDPNDKNSTREALFSFNKKIVDSIGKTLKEKTFKTDEQPLIIVLTNPIDSILKSLIETNNLDPKKTIGSGNQLDTFRFIQNLADKLHIDRHDIENVFVIGQHGKNMVYCLDQIKIRGESLNNYMKDNNISEDEIDDVCNSTTGEGGKIIAAAGATCFGPASSVIAVIDSFIENKNEVFSLSVMHKNGNCFGYPVSISSQGVEIVENFNLTNKEKEELNNSINCINELNSLN